MAAYISEVQFIIIIVQHSGVRADIVLEKELSVLAGKQKRPETMGGVLSRYETSEPTSTVTLPQ